MSEHLPGRIAKWLRWYGCNLSTEEIIKAYENALMEHAGVEVDKPAAANEGRDVIESQE